MWPRSKLILRPPWHYATPTVTKRPHLLFRTPQNCRCPTLRPAALTRGSRTSNLPKTRSRKLAIPRDKSTRFASLRMSGGSRNNLTGYLKVSRTAGRLCSYTDLSLEALQRQRRTSISIVLHIVGRNLTYCGVDPS